MGVRGGGGQGRWDVSACATGQQGAIGKRGGAGVVEDSHSRSKQSTACRRVDGKHAHGPNATHGLCHLALSAVPCHHAHLRRVHLHCRSRGSQASILVSQRSILVSRHVAGPQGVAQHDWMATCRHQATGPTAPAGKALCRCNHAHLAAGCCVRSPPSS